jgi:hypothetical protein
MYAETKCVEEGIALVCVSASQLRWNTTGRGCKDRLPSSTTVVPHRPPERVRKRLVCNIGEPYKYMQQGQSIGETWFNYIIGQLAV